MRTISSLYRHFYFITLPLNVGIIKEKKLFVSEFPIKHKIIKNKHNINVLTTIFYNNNKKENKLFNT